MSDPTENQEVTQSDMLAMSDDDFLKQNPPSSSKPDPEEVETPSTEEPEPAPVEEEEGKPASTEDKSTSTGKVEENGDNKQVTEPVETEQKPAKAPSKSPAASTEDDKAKAEQDDKAKKEPASTEAKPDIDYKSFHDAVMKPFKANGKMIAPKSVEEAIGLMQMGANYTRKMQDLAPKTKILTMLENNGLLDSDKLSFLIDIEKKNPEAIKRLIRESGFDPLEYNPEDPDKYLKGNHEVSDAEVTFRNHLDDLRSSEDGQKTATEIASWDQASKDVLWNNPEIMGIIHNQRENGMYDRITTEMERLRVMGKIPANQPFLQSYKAVGDYLTSQGAFADITGSKPEAQTPAQQEQPKPQPLETKAAKPKPTVTNSDKASAALQTSGTATKTEGKSKDWLAMSDEDFLKLGK